MDIDKKPIQLELTGPEISVEIKKSPSIKTLLLKMAFLSMIRPSTLSHDTSLSKARIVLHNLKPDREIIQRYKSVCGFSRHDPAKPKPGQPKPVQSNNCESINHKSDDTIPISYFQTLFIGLLGKFITTPYFPINPMGLIHIGQSFEQKRPIATDEILDLSCRLHNVTKTQKGITSQFLLEVMSDKKIVWKGISSFFTRSKLKKPLEKRPGKKKEAFLSIMETIIVPWNMGRQYAKVSGDYNPHHLHWLTARVFGFKQPIAHGMWSLARVIASLENECDTQYPLGVNAEFKLPIFMPATITLGYKKIKSQPPGDLIDFELRDEKKGLPHLKGQFYF